MIGIILFDLQKPNEGFPEILQKKSIFSRFYKKKKYQNYAQQTLQDDLET